MLDFKGKVAFVAGAGSVGPGWGNGKAVAVLLARQGAKVYGTDLRAEAVDETRRIIEGEGGNTALVDEEDVNEEAQGLLHTLLHKRTGLDKFELNMVQQWNDAYNGHPENRYAHVLSCVRWRAENS